MARRPLEREEVYLDGGRRTTQLMRDSLGGGTTKMPARALILRILLVLCGVETPLAAILAIRGFPFVGVLGGAVFMAGGGTVYWWERVVATLHGPGIFLLTSLGMCCGFGGGPIGDEYIEGHTAMTIGGVVFLASANVLAWGFPTYVVARLVQWRVQKRGFQAAA